MADCDELPLGELGAIFSSEGPLAKAFPSFEYREEQVAMAHDVARTLSDRGIALIEAGTGTGKSMAYLVPALLAAHRQGERTVISTHTIALQEQLISKDIPSVTAALGLPVRAVLMKGMGNYICRRRLVDAEREKRLFDSEDREEIERIAEWAEQHEEGAISDLLFHPSWRTVERTRMESDGCSHAQCPFFRRCYFFKARQAAEEGEILVVNHHLLLADLAYRMENEGEGGILPNYDHLILDEAHHLEEVATDTFATRVARRDIQRILGRLRNEKRGKLSQGKLDLLTDRLWGLPESDQHALRQTLFQKLEVTLPADQREVEEALSDFFEVVGEYLERQGQSDKLRLLEEHLQSADWLGAIQTHGQAAVESLRGFVQLWKGIEEQITEYVGESMEDRLRNLSFDVGVLVNRLDRVARRLEGFLQEESDADQVRWMERVREEPALFTAQLDVSDFLAKWLFTPGRSVLLSSATLAAGGRFTFYRQRLGLNPERLGERGVLERIYDSPFDYAQQALLAVRSDLPHPNAVGYIEGVAESIRDAVEASNGSAFVLFTSYRTLRQVHAIVQTLLEEQGFTLLCQKDMGRQELLAHFRMTPKAVLFGTDSFWEGVDVAGEALRCVVITKLPFRVPTEPIIQAQMERVEAEGGQSFRDYSLPHAIVKFKQGFGRLIRHREDRGSILCLDSRLVHKFYGRAFLRSLPSCSTEVGGREEVQHALHRFFGARERAAEECDTGSLK